MNRFGRCALAALFLWVAAGTASAAEEQGFSYELWTDYMSPYCPGRVLIDCPSPQADQLRAWIQDQERAGRSREEVERELYARYGDVILQAPRAQGFGLAAYVIPVAAALVGVAAVLFFLRRQARSASTRPAEGPAPPVALDPEVERRIDRELEALR